MLMIAIRLIVNEQIFFFGFACYSISLLKSISNELFGFLDKLIYQKKSRIDGNRISIFIFGIAIEHY